MAAERMPASLVPLIVVLDELPMATSGKVDRKALPWPPPGTEATAGGRRVAHRRRAQARRALARAARAGGDRRRQRFLRARRHVARGRQARLGVARRASGDRRRRRLRAPHPARAGGAARVGRRHRDRRQARVLVRGDAAPRPDAADRRVRTVRGAVGSMAARGARLRRHRRHRHAPRRMALARRGLGAAREPARAHRAAVHLHPRSVARP